MCVLYFYIFCKCAYNHYLFDVKESDLHYSLYAYQCYVTRIQLALFTVPSLVLSGYISLSLLPCAGIIGGITLIMVPVMWHLDFWFFTCNSFATFFFHQVLSGLNLL